MIHPDTSINDIHSSIDGLNFPKSFPNEQCRSASTCRLWQKHFQLRNNLILRSSKSILNTLWCIWCIRRPPWYSQSVAINLHCSTNFQVLVITNVLHFSLHLTKLVFAFFFVVRNKQLCVSFSTIVRPSVCTRIISGLRQATRI